MRRNNLSAWLGSGVWNAAAFLWGVAEGTLFFIVPDVLLSAAGLKRGARAGAVASVCAALGAALGGSLMYLWSVRDPASALGAVLAVPAVSQAMVSEAALAMAGPNWFPATLAGPLSFTPYKVYAILAPQAGANLAAFAAASVLARLPRFVLISFGASFLRARFGDRVSLAWLAGAWMLFYAVFFALTPG